VVSNLLNKKTGLLLVNAAISFIILALILHLVGIDEVVNALVSIDLGLLALSMVFLLFMDLIMTYRVKLLLDHSRNDLSFFDVFKAHIIGMLAADFTPARSGYLATAAVLRYKYHVPSEKAMVSILGPQIFDFALKVIAGTTAIIYMLYRFIGPEDGWIIILASFFMMIMLSIMILLLFSKRFLKLFSFTSSIPLISRIYALFERMQKNSYVILDKTPQLILLMLLSWTAKSLSWFAAAKSVGITVSTEFPEVIFYFFLQPLITMIEFMPTPTIAGLGLSEGGATLVFSLFGVSGATAAIFALIVRFKTTFVHLPAIPGALNILRKKIS
jgi:uncharacterized protein (TIRG00374 family)